jgi:eukaryotic-like serine/threonine-protein kinase
MTTPQRWQEIDRIFAAALELEPEEREAFLDRACAGDEQLRKEVESLIAHDVPDSFVGGPEEATRVLANVRLGLNEAIGPYRIVRELGAGGMGRVYLCHDKRLNRPVAVKLISNYHAAEEERIKRFRQEALAASALNHPNILTIYEIGEAEGKSFIATEFVDGPTLSSRIEAGSISIDDSLNIAIQMAGALAAAHAAGIIHRDIKPSNVIVRMDGLVKVLDFGIAKYAPEDGEELQKGAQLLTTPGAVMGTAAYMSPEQARGVAVDTRTDIWSLGVVLYEMVAGCRPFSGDTAMDVMSAVIERQPLPVSAHNPLVHEQLEKIVFKALQKEKDFRYQTVLELLADLKSAKREIDVLEERASSNAQQQSANTSAAAAGGTGKPKSDKESTKELVDAPTVPSSAEYIVSSIRKHKLAMLVPLVALIIASGLLAYRFVISSNSSQIESIAVLPFVNEGGNSEVEYLSDGMTDTLINSLSLLPNMSVKARTSVFRYKGKDADPQRIGSELSVQAILSGRVVQRDGNLTLYVSLVDARDGNQLWGERYDRKMADLISLQREIARDVSQKLRARLSGADQQKITKDYTANTEAYQLYLKGRFHILRLTPPEVQKGIAYFNQAIEIDPNYALAYVGISGANRSLALGGEMNPMEFLPKSIAAAQKAINIDDGLAEAHTALGASIFWYQWNWNEAENQLKRAVELDPNSAEGHLFYAHLLSNTGRHAEALAEIKRARELDPFSPFVNALEGQFLVHAGKPDEALARLRETFELAPAFWFPHVFAASAYIEKGMFAEAIAEARRATELSTTQTVSVALEGYALAKLGKPGEARDVLDRLLKLSKERFVPPYHIAFIYNGLGDRDQAFEWLERGFEQRDPKMAFLKVEPRWNNLRDDPRFIDLMRRVGFSQ